MDPVEDWVARGESIPKYLDEAVGAKSRKRYCGIRRKADRIPTEGGQQSDDCGQPMIAA
ncbi:MAG: hypothetical protein WBW73_23710 [Rhodoplanes sp.]